MIGTTLGEIRNHVESLATPARCYLVCGRTRDRTVPADDHYVSADDLYFETRTSARAGGRATEAGVRAAVRQYDPQVYCYGYS